MGIRISWPWPRKKQRLQTELLEWYAAGVKITPTGTVVDPPWIVYPEEDPWWGGWRQGNSEGWLHYVWLPFWRNMDSNGREEYLEKWNATSEWRLYLQERKDTINFADISAAEHVLNLYLYK